MWNHKVKVRSHKFNVNANGCEKPRSSLAHLIIQPIVSMIVLVRLLERMMHNWGLPQFFYKEKR